MEDLFAVLHVAVVPALRRAAAELAAAGTARSSRTRTTTTIRPAYLATVRGSGITLLLAAVVVLMTGKS